MNASGTTPGGEAPRGLQEKWRHATLMTKTVIVYAVLFGLLIVGGFLYNPLWSGICILTIIAIANGLVYVGIDTKPKNGH